MRELNSGECELLRLAGSRTVEELAQSIGLAIARVVAAARADGGAEDVESIVRRWLGGLELHQRLHCLTLALSEQWQSHTAAIARAARRGVAWTSGLELDAPARPARPERSAAHQP